MRRAGVLALALVLLAVAVDGQAKRMAALKQSSAALLSRWQQRVMTSPHVENWLRNCTVMALCVTQACCALPLPRAPEPAPAPETGGENSAAGVIADQTQPSLALPAAPKMPEIPEVQGDRAPLIKTELFGEGITAARGLTYESIAAYQESKDQLPPQFYDGMMIHQIKDGFDYVRIVDLIDGEQLKVRYVNSEFHKVVDPQTISGVMVGTHPDYEGRYVSFAAKFARPVNDQGGERLLENLPAGAVFYGKTNMVFSDGDYAIEVFAFSLVANQIMKFPQVLRFIVPSEHLITIRVPERPPQKRTPPPEKNKYLAAYHSDDGDHAPISYALRF